MEGVKIFSKFKYKLKVQYFKYYLAGFAIQ